MAVSILGNNTSPTVIGTDVTIDTGNTITTLAASTPITIQSSGNHSDSLWDISGNIIYPDITGYKVGLNTIDNGSVADYLLTQDGTTREIKRMSGLTYADRSHTHKWIDIISGTPTTLSGYGITDAQPLDVALTQISGLSYSSPAFLKKTGSGTWALDTNTYSVTGHTHAYQPTLPVCSVDDYVLSSKADGTLSWVEMSSSTVVGGGTPGEVDLSAYATKDSPIFTTSFGFSTWRYLPSGSDMILNYNGALKSTITSNGDGLFKGDVVAYSA